MATEAPEKLLLSETLRQATAALSVLDTATLERLIARLGAVQAGALEMEREPEEAIRDTRRLLRSVLAATKKNMQVLERLDEREASGRWVR
jgi:hypothetical protein